MLSFDHKNLPLLSEERLKKQRTALLIIAFLLLVGGILLGVAYLIIGYLFITSPLAGIRGVLSSRLFHSLAARPHNYVDVPVASVLP